MDYGSCLFYDVATSRIINLATGNEMGYEVTKNKKYIKEEKFSIAEILEILNLNGVDVKAEYVTGEKFVFDGTPIEVEYTDTVMPEASDEKDLEESNLSDLKEDRSDKVEAVGIEEFLASDIIVYSPLDRTVGLEKSYFMVPIMDDLVTSLHYVDVLGTGDLFVSEDFLSASFWDCVKYIISPPDSSFSISSINDYLMEMGLSEYIQDRYSKDDLIKIGKIMECASEYNASDVYVLDSSLMDVDLDSSSVDDYYFLVDNKAISSSYSYFDEKYQDVNNIFGSCYFEDKYTYCCDNVCMTSKDDGSIPDQIGREDLKQERYSWAEIQQISNRVMKKGVTLIRTPK